MGLVVAVGLAEAISVVTVLESVAAVGAVLSVVGMVTKNKTLSMIGAGLGVVGGVGALAAGALGATSVLASGADAATSAGDATAATAAGDSAFTTGTAAGDAALNAGGAGTGALGGGIAGPALTTETAGLGAADAVPDTLGALSGVPSAGTVPGTALSGASDAVAPADNLSLASTSQPVGQTSIAAPDGSVQPNVPPPASSGGVNPAPSGGSGLSAQANPELNTPGGATEAGPTGILGGLFDKGGALGGLAAAADAHPTLAFGAVQGVASLVSGFTSTLTPAQVAALQSQSAANDAAAAMTNQQRANLAMPKAVALSSPVTGTPQTLVPGGFINQAPKQPAVTGAPA
jgi:hypothetical protein